MHSNKVFAGVISLGCSKNRVDSERILACLRDAGFAITADESAADVIIINTCGFIEPAKQESINTILETAAKKKTGALLAVAGCLSQRYPKELEDELPEVDVWHGVGDHEGLVEKLRGAMGMKGEVCYHGERVLTTPPYSAYLRIADGCDNRCTYCAIPLIRGAKKSVPMEILLQEAQTLADGGVKELTLIAQDTSAYGTDIYSKPMLGELLEKLASIAGLKWIRVLYAYPNTIDERLVNIMLAHDNIVKYIDMPIQHIAPELLERMNRHGSAEHIRSITEYIRKASPEFILRTTVMTGFPGETDEQFGQLAEFLRDHPFDRVGAFAYSQEDGTPAADFTDQVDEATAQKRLSSLMLEQRRISLELNRRRIGRTYECIVERVKDGIAMCRSYAEAPEVDGLIRITGVPDGIKPGDFIPARIVSAGAYDLRGVYSSDEPAK